MSRGRLAVCAAVLVVALAAGFAVYRRGHEQPPYGPEGLGFAVTAELLPSGEQPDGEYHGVQFSTGEGWMAVGGRLTWRPAPESSTDWHDNGWFMIFVVDKRVQLKPNHVWGVSSTGIRVVAGGDAVQNRVAEEYPWLRAAGDIKVDDNTWLGTGTCLSTSPATGEVTFVAAFPPVPDGEPERRPVAAAPIALSDIMIAVAYIGTGRQVYWAERVYG
ncbi:hypothetical protein [Catellatospora vulcania]|uniref:hypothetical protein n=1 Tax=Catellatospora vulcania TaxID=1460450 RepID=UPI0012D38AB5|nr:hypothetical protein [Catellatospora vulcania]